MARRASRGRGWERWQCGVKTCIGTSEEGQRQRADEKLIAAKDLFDSCSSEACPKIVRDDCIGWAKEVDALLPTIVFVVRDASGKDMPTASILIDGSSSHIVDGTAVQLDPGAHVLRVTAGDRQQDQNINVMEGEKNRHVQFTLPDAAQRPSTAKAGSVGSASSPPKEGVPIVPLIVGGVSLVVIGLGVFFQLAATSEDNTSKASVPAADNELGAKPSCAATPPNQAACPSAYAVYTHHDAAKNDQTVALTMIGIGAGGLIASGVFLCLLWPRQQRTAQSNVMLLPSLGPSTAGMSLRASF